MQIGELSRLTGISTRMLRHYDTIGLISPSNRSANGYRDYGPSDITRLMHVEGLKTLGLSLSAIGDALDDTDLAPTDLIDDLIDATRERIAREQQLIARLGTLRDSKVESWSDALDVIALLQGLDSPDASRRQRVALAGTAPAGALVEALLAETDPNVAGAMSWAVARSAGDAVPALAAALDAPDEQTRLRAITAITRIDTERTRPTLKDALHHADRQIRESAALALGATGDLDAVPELTDMVVRGSHDVDAAEALGRLAREHGCGDRLSTLIAEQLVSENHTTGARGRLTQALGEIPGSGARDILIALADDGDQAVSLTARYLLTVRVDD